jgi:hypothetical protein
LSGQISKAPGFAGGYLLSADQPMLDALRQMINTTADQPKDHQTGATP